MDVLGFFLAVRKRWWVVILATVIGAAAAVGITSLQAKQYSSSVTFFVATPSAEPGQAYQANLYAQALVNSYVKLLSSDELARRVIAQAGLHATPQAVAEKISGTAGLNTVLLTATATDSTPAGAVRLGSAVATAFGPMVSSLNNNYNTTASKSPIVLSVVSGPTSPVKVAPRRALNYLLGIFVGLVVGLAFAAVRELLDTSVRSDEQVAAAGTGVLASISRIQRYGPLPLIADDLDRSILAEEMRQLRTSLQYMQRDRPVKVIAVVSPEAAEGRSTVAINLALAFAEAGRQTLLIDADLRRPQIAEYLGIDGAAGLCDVLAQQVGLDTALRTWGEQKLHVLASGPLPPHPAELLGSRQMADLAARLRSEFDTIIIDTPPLRPVTDGVTTALLSDGAIVVVRNGRTSRAQLGHALQALRAVDVPVLGAVHNMVPLRRPGKSAYRAYAATRPSDAAADKHRPRTTRGSHDTAGAAISPANTNTDTSPNGSPPHEPTDTQPDSRAVRTPLLAVRKKMYGLDHPDTLDTGAQLARGTGEAGDPAGARDQYAALVPIYDKAYGPDHSDALETRGSLAYWTGEAGDAASARDQYAALLPMYDKAYGPDQPDTLAIRANLANMTGLAGDPAGARDQYAALVPIYDKTYGPDHPDTLETRGSLAYWTGGAGDAASARDQYAALLPLHDKIHGPDHPDTLAVRANLANWAGLAGDPRAAREQHRELLPVLQEVQGPDHPATLAVRANLANMTGLAGDSAGARDLYAALVPVIERTQGPDHPAAQSARSNLAHWSRKAHEDDPASRGRSTDRPGSRSAGG